MAAGCAQPLSWPYELSRGTCLHCTSLRKMRAGREAITTTDAHNPAKQLAKLVLPSAPNPASLKAFRNYKNSAGATNLNSGFPPHLQLSQASHISVCPKILLFKGILQSLQLSGRKQVQRPQGSYCGLLLSACCSVSGRGNACLQQHRQLYYLVWHQGEKLSSIFKLDSGNQLGTSNCHF